MAKRIKSSRAKRKDRTGKKLKAKKIHFGPKKGKKDAALKKKVKHKVKYVLKSSADTQGLSLRDRMMLKLKASRFRYLNEQLYNMKGNEALNYFKKDKDSFIAYHEGYKKQVEQWPVNPLNEIINSIKSQYSKQKEKRTVIADFGCGDATLAKSLPEMEVHSFDLMSLDPCVTVCDMSSTPLNKASVDVAVFCLSLMGTNFVDYLVEANRVLKMGGRLKIAEVESRFEDVEKFARSMSKLGFSTVSKNFSHKLFYFLDFKKEKDASLKAARTSHLTLKPCLYKKR